MHLGTCYYPEHWPQEMWADDARRMRALGLSRVRIAEFAWSRIEPARGRFEWDWLDQAVETLGAAGPDGDGLGVIMCTPTATPPRWLVAEMPDMVPLDEHGRPRGFGSRRHYDFSHEGYLAEARRITEAVARRYGANEHVVAWQTDNEYGCHDTTVSWSPAALAAFRSWLAQRYGSIDALNRAWGTVFWSMEYGAFDEIELPNLAVTETAPAHRMDFRRHASEAVARFNAAQVAIIRRHSPGRDVTHNFMGAEVAFDHFPVGRDLDFATWDSYPLGFLQRAHEAGQCDRAWRDWYLRAGDPDFQAFHHDLYRAVGRGRWGVMEQQPGPVNWASWNPAPHPGQVRLWTWEAAAHGAELVSYFRWRQAPFAQEQMHTGLRRPDDTPDVASGEVERVARELVALGLADGSEPAPVAPAPASVAPAPASVAPAPASVAPAALVFDYASQWAVEIQPQGRDFDAFGCVMAFYRALRCLGLSVDIVAPGDPLDGHAMVVVPLLVMASDEAVAVLEAFKGPVLIGARSGSRTHDFAVPPDLPPGRLRALVPARVERVESLPPGTAPTRWREWVDGEVEHRDRDGMPTVLSHTGPNGTARYLATWPEPDLLTEVLDAMCEEAGVATLDLPEDVRARDGRGLRWFFNHGPRPVRLPTGLAGGSPGSDTFALGGRDLDVAGVAAVRLG